jgi:hypothetical protein
MLVIHLTPMKGVMSMNGYKKKYNGTLKLEKL